MTTAVMRLCAARFVTSACTDALGNKSTVRASAASGRTTINRSPKAVSMIFWVRIPGFRRTPQKKMCNFNELQTAKTGSSLRICGPAWVTERELFAGRNWREVISTDGVVCLVASVRRPHDRWNRDKLVKSSDAHRRAIRATTIQT
jgi:hypothetical protein